MKKESKKKDKKPKENSFSSFLKKRAPIYLGLTGLFILFIVPELMTNSLEDLFPEDLTDDEKEILDIVMSYNGPDKEGLTILKALDTQIKEEFEDDKIYNDKSSMLLIDITTPTTDEKNYDVTFTFTTDDKDVQYTWNVNTQTQEIKGQNTSAKNIIDLVDFYD